MLTKEQEKIYKKYKFTGMTEETFLEIYNSVVNGQNFETSLYYAIVEKIKTSVTLEMLLNFLDTLKIDSNLLLKDIKKILQPFFDLLVDLEYEPSQEELDILLEHQNLTLLFSKIVGNRDYIFDYELEVLEEYDKILGELFQSYLKKEEIKIKSQEINENVKVDNALNQYMKEIDKFPILEKREQLRLGKEKELGSEEAFQRLCDTHLKLVVNIAKSKTNSKLELEDSIQEGNIGLIKSIKKYDYTKNCKLSTYAMPWIKQEIFLAEVRAKSIKMPPEEYRSMRIIFAIQDRYLKEKGKLPTEKELSLEMNLPEEKIKEILQLMHETERVSLDQEVEREDNQGTEKTIIRSFKEDETCFFEEGEILKITGETALKRAKSVLTKEEYQILYLLCGFDDNIPKNMEEIGSILGITREAVRQRKKKIINILLNDTKISALNPFSVPIEPKKKLLSAKEELKKASLYQKMIMQYNELVSPGKLKRIIDEITENSSITSYEWKKRIEIRIFYEAAEERGENLCL